MKFILFKNISSAFKFTSFKHSRKAFEHSHKVFKHIHTAFKFTLFSRPTFIQHSRTLIRHSIIPVQHSCRSMLPSPSQHPTHILPDFNYKQLNTPWYTHILSKYKLYTPFSKPIGRNKTLHHLNILPQDANTRYLTLFFILVLELRDLNPAL